jgi:predicted nuclease of predicted toxin-antitoxin system
MRVLLDECLPVGLREPVASYGHPCDTVVDAGLSGKKNGELLALAEGKWDVLLTGDSNIRHQQNLAGRKIAILVIRARSNRLVDLLPAVPACARALESIKPGHITEIWYWPTGAVIKES